MIDAMNDRLRAAYADPRFNPLLPLPVDQIKPRWPADVAVPRRQVAGLRDAQLGTEEGDLCLRTEGGYPPCLGKLELRRAPDQPGCYCWRCAPCGSCMSEVPECSICGHREPEAC